MTKLLLAATIAPRLVSTFLRSTTMAILYQSRTVSTTSSKTPPPSAVLPMFRPLDIARVGNALEKPMDLKSLESCGDENKTTLTLTGYKGGRPQDQINQDSAMIVCPFTMDHDTAEQNPADETNDVPLHQILGVFDGHGKDGELTSQYASAMIPRLLSERISASYNTTFISQQIRDVFNEVDQVEPSGGHGGCTASVVLHIKGALSSKIYVANTGDSVSAIAVMIKGDPSRNIQQDIQIAYMTREDKPDLPDERKRILEAGGYVHIPRNPKEDVPRAYHVNERGQLEYGLAMSRSIGDHFVQGVIADPIVDVLDIEDIKVQAMKLYSEQCQKSSDDTETCAAVEPSDVLVFAVSYTDGLADYLSPIDVAQILGPSFFTYGEDAGVVHPHKAAQQLIIKAANAWYDEEKGHYRDDIAIAASKII